MNAEIKDILSRKNVAIEVKHILGFDPDTSLDLVSVFDSELNYLLLNASACILLAKKKEELEGKNLLHVFPQLTASSAHRNILSALSGKTLMDMTSEGIITREGAKFLSNYYPLKQNGSVYAVLTHTKTLYFPTV